MKPEFPKTIGPTDKTDRNSESPLTFDTLSVCVTGKFHFHNPEIFCFKHRFVFQSLISKTL